MESHFVHLGDSRTGLERRLAPGIRANIFSSDSVMLSYVTFEPDAEGAIHSHPEEQWGVVLEGSGCRIQGGREVDVVPGDAWRTPGGVEHGFRAGPDGARILDIFVPPRNDYRAPGEGFGRRRQDGIQN